MDDVKPYTRDELAAEGQCNLGVVGCVREHELAEGHGEEIYHLVSERLLATARASSGRPTEHFDSLGLRQRIDSCIEQLPSTLSPGYCDLCSNEPWSSQRAIRWAGGKVVAFRLCAMCGDAYDMGPHAVAAVPDNAASSRRAPMGHEDTALLDWAESHPAVVMRELHSWWAQAGSGARELFFAFRQIIRTARNDSEEK